MICFSQEKAHLIAYRIVNDIDHRPCNVKSYLNDKVAIEYTLPYVTAETNDEQLIERLLAIKKQAPSWNARAFYCSEKMLSGESIPTMFIIRTGTKMDTIFTTHNNIEIVFPDENKAYTDKKNLLKSVLSGTIKEFFEHDFRKRFRALFIPEIDTVSVDKIFYKGKLIKDFLKDFENDSNDFRLVSTDSVSDDIERVYAYDNDTISIYKGKVIITANNLKSGMGY